MSPLDRRGFLKATAGLAALFGLGVPARDAALEAVEELAQDHHRDYDETLELVRQGAREAGDEEALELLDESWTPADGWDTWGLYLDGELLPVASFDLRCAADRVDELRSSRATVVPRRTGGELSVEAYFAEPGRMYEELLSSAGREYAVEVRRGNQTLEFGARLRGADLMVAGVDEDVLVQLTFDTGAVVARSA